MSSVEDTWDTVIGSIQSSLDNVPGVQVTSLSFSSRSTNISDTKQRLETALLQVKKNNALDGKPD